MAIIEAKKKKNQKGNLEGESPTSIQNTRSC